MVNDDNLQNKGLLKIYCASVYWAMTTVSTVGYGDIVAKTSTERIINIIFMIIGLAVFNYIMGTIDYVLA